MRVEHAPVSTLPVAAHSATGRQTAGHHGAVAAHAYPSGCCRDPYRSRSSGASDAAGNIVTIGNATDVQNGSCPPCRRGTEPVDERVV